MISVVIPAFNEEKIITQCLEGLAHQQTAYPYEVILVDNNSTDATSDIAKTFAEKMPLRIVTEIQKGRGHARAAGFAKAKGEIILSTDADAVVPSDWIEKMVNSFTSKEIVAVTGIGKVTDASFLQNSMITLGLPWAMHIYALVHHHYWLSGFNFGIKKDIYDKSGGFRQINGFEDIDLGIRVSKLGIIKYVPVCVIMSGRRFHKGLSKGFWAYFGAYLDYFYMKKSDVYMPDIRS